MGWVGPSHGDPGWGVKSGSGTGGISWAAVAGGMCRWVHVSVGTGEKNLFLSDLHFAGKVKSLSSFLHRSAGERS